MPLSEQRRQQLDGIVSQMQANRESDSDIQSVVNDFKTKYSAEGPSNTSVPTQQSPSFWSEAYQNVVQPIVDTYHSAQSEAQQHGAASFFTFPAHVAKSALDAQVEQGRQAWQALTGQGQFSDMTPLERTSSAVGHSLGAALPVLGPMAVKAGENFGSGNVGAGIADTATIGAAMYGPRLARAAGDAIPTFEKAGANFDAAMAQAANMPIDVTAPGNVALRAQQLAASGGQLPKVLRDFISRATKPNSPPITYAEARDFYSNATRLSADEFNRLSPNSRRLVGEFTQSLGQSIADAANRAGVGDEYSSAMRQYRQASSIRDAAQGAKDIGVNAVKYAAPVGVGGYLVKRFLDTLR